VLEEKQKKLKERIEAFHAERLLISKILLDDENALLPGRGISWFQFEAPSSKILRTFDSPSKIDYEVEISSDELTAMCPLTGFPDFYDLKITYAPNKKCIESKSFKFYIGSFRESGMFIETLTNKIADDLVEACNPSWLMVENTMKARGGVPITVTAERYQNRGEDDE